MSELVQIAPGVVFSSDVLGVEWVRKCGRDGRNTGETDKKRYDVCGTQSSKKNDPDTADVISGQMSLL